MMPPRGPRRVLCVVEVTTWACGERAGILAGGNEAGDVRHVDQEDRADLIGDLVTAPSP